MVPPPLGRPTPALPAARTSEGEKRPWGDGYRQARRPCCPFGSDVSTRPQPRPPPAEPINTTRLLVGRAGISSKGEEANTHSEWPGWYFHWRACCPLLCTSAGSGHVNATFPPRQHGPSTPETRWRTPSRGRSIKGRCFRTYAHFLRLPCTVAWQPPSCRSPVSREGREDRGACCTVLPLGVARRTVRPRQCSRGRPA